MKCRRCNKERSKPTSNFFDTSQVRSGLAILVGIIPGIGSILSDVATGEVYYDTGTAGTILNLIKVLAKNPEDRREGQLANAISKSFVEAFQLAGIPSNTPMKVYDAITELNPGELVNSQWADFISYIRD